MVEAPVPPPPAPLAALIAVETGQQGNLGALLRVAANFGLPRVELVRPLVSPDDPEVQRWACGARDRLAVSVYGSLADAAAPYHTLIGTTSARGRERQPVIGPRALVGEVARRGPDSTALVVGNETWGLRREDLDRCDLVVRVPTHPEFPVLSLPQTAAVLLGYLAIQLDQAPQDGPPPAPAGDVEHLLAHLGRSLLSIGFLDPANPDRILRKLRRLLGRAGVTDNEVAILRAVCRQIDWVAEKLSAVSSQRSAPPPARPTLPAGGAGNGSPDTGEAGGADS